MNIVELERRLFGVVPAGLLFALGVGLPVLGVVAAALGAWVVAALLLGVGAAALTLFLVDARRRPASSVAAQTAARVLAACAGWRIFVVRASRAWLLGRNEQMRLRRELGRLRADYDRLQFALGAAAYREDAGQVQALRASLRELERRSEQCASQLDALSAQIHRSMQRERLAAQRTKLLARDRNVREVEVYTNPQ